MNSLHTSPAPERSAAAALSVVMPVFNEERFVGEALRALLSDAATAGVELEVVVVDDGSTDGSPAVLAEIAGSHREVRVLRQNNAGRLEARRAGLGAVHGDRVLLLDSRVIIQQGSLAWLRDQLTEHPERVVWCGHVDVATDGNPYAAFWSGLVKVGWHRYTRRPRLVSFGIEEFDRYPKGTGCLVITKDLLAQAGVEFSSLYADASLASDDTKLLRQVARHERIWLGPDFAFEYHGRSSASGFLRQSYFRGTTFVDGYLGQQGPVGKSLGVAALAAVALVALAVRRPAVALGGAGAVLVGMPALVAVAGGAPQEVRAAAALTPLFAPTFGAGLLRGLVLAAAARLRGRARVTAQHGS